MRATRHVLLTLLFATSCLADVRGPLAPPTHAGVIPFSKPPAARGSRFAPLSATCNHYQSPTLLHGDLTALSGERGNELIVDLIIGFDGNVESPMVVEASNPALAHKIVERIAEWRYRPAICDGAPVESEGRITVRLGPNTTAETR